MREAGREQIVRGPNRGPGEPRPSSPRRAFGHGTPRRGDQPRLKSPVKPSWARLDHGEGVLRDRAAAWAPTRLWPRGRRLGQQLPLREDGTRGLGSAEVVLLTLHKRVQTRTCVQVGASDGLGCKDDDWVPPTCRNSCVLLEPTFSPALSFVLCPLHFHHGLRARAQREACGATTTCLRRAQAAHTATTGSKAPPFRPCPTSPAVVPAEVVVDAVALMPAEGLPRTERRTSAGLRPPSTSSCSGATTMRIRSSIAGSM